jgi:putative spermidine/putrescine transport system permease protein
MGAAVTTEVVQPSRPQRPPVRGDRAWVGRIGPTLVIVACAVFFVLPLVSMARFALQNVPMVKLGSSTLFKGWSLRFLTDAFDEPEFWPTLRLSLQLAVGTVALSLGLLLPTALYVNLRLPRARSFVEFLTVLPYVVPPIALVAGVAAFFRPNAKWYLNSDYALIPLYVVMALPFTYRAIDAGIRAIDLRTLVDASRSLGAGWARTVWRVLLPNLSASIVSATFLTATVVLGEFTIATTLAKTTFPVFSYRYFTERAQGGIALALFTLVASTALLGVLTLLTRRKARRIAAPRP